MPGQLTLDLGGVKVQIWHPGPGRTRGDTIAWAEDEKVLFSGDLVEYEAGVYTGDAQLEEWPATLEALRALKAEAIAPGRGEALKGAANVNKALDYTRRWVLTLFQAGKEAAAEEMALKAAMAHIEKRWSRSSAMCLFMRPACHLTSAELLTKPATLKSAHLDSRTRQSDVERISSLKCVWSFFFRFKATCPSATLHFQIKGRDHFSKSAQTGLAF